MNQKYTIERPEDICLGLHLGTIHSMINLFPCVVDMLKVIEIEGDDWQRKSQAKSLLWIMENFELIFCCF